MSTSGKFGKGSIGTVPVAINGLQEWNVEETGDTLDATDAESGGVENTDVGVIGARISISGVHKLSSGPFPGMRTGTILTDLTLHLNSTVMNALWKFPSSIITRCTSASRVRGQITWSSENRNKGVYTGPTT